MANRILIANMYNTTSSVYLLNVSPAKIRMKGGDDVYLLIKAGNVSNTPISVTFSITMNDGDGNPFTTALPNNLSATTGTPVHIGTLNTVTATVNSSYTIIVTYNNNNYQEDPTMKINV